MLLKILPFVNIALSLIVSATVVYFLGFSKEADTYFLITSIVTFMQSTALSFWQGKWLAYAQDNVRDKELKSEFMVWFGLLALVLLFIYQFIYLIPGQQKILAITLVWIGISIFSTVPRVLHHSDKNHIRVYLADAIANSCLLISVLFTIKYSNILFLVSCFLLRELLLIICLLQPKRLFCRPDIWSVKSEGYSIFVISLITKPTILIDKILLTLMSPGLLTLYSLCNSSTAMVRKYVWQAISLPSLSRGLDYYALEKIKLYKVWIPYVLLQFAVAFLIMFIVTDKYELFLKLGNLEIPNIILYFLIVASLRVTVGIVQSIIQQIYFKEKKYFEILFPIALHEVTWLILKLIAIMFSENFFLLALVLQNVTLALLIKQLVKRNLV